MDRRFDACVLIAACFCACVNACVMTQLAGCQVSKDTKDLGGYISTYPIIRKWGSSLVTPDADRVVLC